MFAVKEGLALTSSSHGLNVLSISISYPYNSNQCLSCIITDDAAFNDL